MEWSETQELRHVHVPQSCLSLCHDKDGIQAQKT